VEISGHCSFCEHKEFDFTTGNLCGLTKQKADFIRKCPKIMFGDTAKEEIARINLEYKELQDRKYKTINHLILYTVLGIAIFLIDFYLAKRLLEVDWIIASTRYSGIVAGMAVVLIAAGMSAIGYAFTPYIKYTNANSVVKSQKKRMDDFLQLYDYDYKINFEAENHLTGITLHRSKPKIR